MKTKISLVLMLSAMLSALLSACGNYRSSIPDMPVYVERYLVNINCLVPGSYWHITRPQTVSDAVGFGGIILVYAFDNQYYAFDMACPHEAQASKRIDLPDESLNATCPHCGEVYNLGFGMGTPSLGICDEPLRRYRCTLYPDGSITVHR